MQYIIDTSVVVERAVSKLVKENKIEGTILLPKAVLAEIENQANSGRDTGLIGLEEIQELQKLVKKGKIELKIIGERPNIYQIQEAKRGGEIDSYIRDLAYDASATLITADKIQAESAKALDIEVLFLAKKDIKEKLQIETYFDANTMSVHLKEDCYPRGKRGKPGEWELVNIKDNILTQAEVQDMAMEILEAARTEARAFIEISRPGSTIIQYKELRIVITKPPVSDGWEITVARPITILKLEDYNLPEKIAERIKVKTRGVIIAGQVGSGKCLPKGTKVHLKGNIIKNIEEIKKGDRVLSLDKSGMIIYKEVIKTYKREISETLKIQTNFGKEIELTPEHPIMSFKNGIPQWIEAKELEIGSRIATLRKLDNEGEMQKINWVDILPDKKFLVRINKDLKIELPIEDILFGLKQKIILIIKKEKACSLKVIKQNLNSKSGWISYCLLELIKEEILERKKSPRYVYQLKKEKIKIKKGMVIKLEVLKKIFPSEKIYDLTNGIAKYDLWHRCSEITPPRYVTKEFCELLGYYIGESLTKYGISTDSELSRKRFIELSKKIFNIEVEKKRKIYDVYTDKYGTIELFLNRCMEISLLKSKKRATNHRIPPLILRSQKIEIASFIRAYFDTEAYIHKEKGLEITSASIGLIKDTQYALLNFNIQSSIRQKIIKNKPYYTLYIYGYEQIKRLHSEIGLIDKEKQIQIFFKNSKQGSPNKDTIPLTELFSKINETESLKLKYSMIKERGAFSHKAAQILVTAISPSVKSFKGILELALIELACSEYLEWDKIHIIKRINHNKEVYDLEIEETHNFLAGDIPFIVHNSTFAQSLAEYYASQKFITKTVESPRGLILSNDITQYSKNLASSEELHDILFLSRPDYIIFDEMRDTPDFKLFTDLRLGGSNVLGVLHGATPLDAIQRFIGRLELGMIPSVLDTIIFIEKGNIGQILTIHMLVKVPSGMTEADLARPVIEVKDLITEKLICEIYSFGEETVVIPLQKKQETSPTQKLAEKHIEKVLQKYLDTFEIEILSSHKIKIYVPQKDRARIIGAKGANINKIEKELGISIDVVNLEEATREEKQRLGYHITERGNNLILKIDNPGKTVDIFVNDEFILNTIASKKGEIKIKKKTDLGKKLIHALEDKQKLYIKG